MTHFWKWFLNVGRVKCYRMLGWRSGSAFVSDAKGRGFKSRTQYSSHLFLIFGLCHHFFFSPVLQVYDANKGGPGFLAV